MSSVTKNIKQILIFLITESDVSPEGEMHMRHGIIRICVVLLFILSGCQQEPTSEYILPIGSQYFLGKTSYASVKEHDTDSFNLDKTYANEVTIEEDYLIIEANASQVQNLIDNNQKLMEEITQEFEAIDDQLSVEWSEDYASVIFNVNSDILFSDDPMEALENTGHTFWINYILRTNRILSTGDRDIAVNVTYQNADSGHILSQGLFPYESLTITEDDWNLSNNQDVLLSSEYNGYVDMKMTVKEVDTDKIIFTPQDNDTFYIDDESLCLCLDSVYAEDVTLPYHVEAGDVFVLRVNGYYAMHEDGDDIPDIAPVALIPEQYYVE